MRKLFIKRQIIFCLIFTFLTSCDNSSIRENNIDEKEILKRVDFPTLGLPTIATIPLIYLYPNFFKEEGSFLQFFFTLINTSKNIFFPKNFSRLFLAFVATLFNADPL